MRAAAFSGIATALVLVLAACAPEAGPGAGSETGSETPAAAAPAGEPDAAQTVAVSAPRLEQLWVQTGFEQPEGAALGPDGSYFISSIAGDGTVKDGNGFISKLAPDGSVLMMRWAEGLDAPKGMVVQGDTLYVADIDQVVTFDAHNGTKLGAFAVEGAVFLNDMTVWQDEVLVSDSGTASIHRITGEGVEAFGSAPGWEGINGLLGDGARLLIATMKEGHLIALHAGEGEEIIASGMTNADGIGLVPGGGYLVSGWPGQIHYLSDAGEVTTLLDTEGESILQNDLSVFGDVVVVPNLLPGTVTAWRVVRD